MPEFDRNCFRVACFLQQGIRRLRSRETSGGDFAPDDLRRCQALFRKLDKARSRKLPLAAAIVAGNLEEALYRLRERLTSHLAAQTSRSTAREIPSLKTLYTEVKGLLEEFEAVEVDLKKRLIVVTTDPIELEDVYLGEFEIRLSLDQLGAQRSPYEVVALDANPAAADEGITHPHVKENHLCEGDGVIPIRRALEGGWLADFFQIVIQVLHSYNSGSAFAQLDSWSGVSCADCGASVDPEDAIACNRCEGRMCEGCTWECKGCINDFCSECSQACRRCGRRFCQACLIQCANCEQSFCQSCLSTGKCRDCHDCDTRENTTGDGDSAPSAAVPIAAGETGAALQPAGLGQASIPA